MKTRHCQGVQATDVHKDTSTVKPGVAERVRKHRETIKKDQIKYKAAKEKDRLRKQYEREKQREQMLSDKRLLTSYREKKKVDMRNYRAKKKASKVTTPTPTPKALAGKKVQTRLKDRKRKTEERLQTKLDETKKKEAVKRTQVWRMKIKLRCHKPMDTELASPTPFPSVSTEKRVMARVRSQLPKTPQKKARIVEKLITSPRTSKFLTKKGLITSKKQAKRIKVGEALIAATTQKLSETKQTGTSRKEKARAYRHIKSVLASSKITKKYFNIRNGLKMKKDWWTEVSRKKRKDSIPEATKEQVKEFYQLPETSRQCPSKRDVVRVKEDNGKHTTIQKHVMIMTLSDAYTKYQELYPNTKLGFTSFKKLKPGHVRKVSETSRRTCLCTICCNIALKAEALKKHILSLANKSGEKEHTQGLIKNKDELSTLTLCKDPKSKCLNRQCQICGTQKLKDYYNDFTNSYQNKMILWYKWEYINIAKQDKVKRCISCVPKETSFQKFIEDVAEDMNKYPAHTFRAGWQQKKMGECLRYLCDGEIMVVMDFSENYSCKFQNEVQSAFFEQNQVTIHPMMVYYYQHEEDRRILVKHVIIGISPDTHHDAHAVKTFEDEAYKIISSNIDVTKVYQWTDGCACQYKGKTSFADLSLRKIPIERHFFETSHGKNVCDGLGAVIKNYCSQAVISGKAVIATAEHLYEYIHTNLSHSTKIVTKGDSKHASRRQIIWVPKIHRERPEIAVQTLKGTRLLHAIRNKNGSYLLESRNLSCFCTGCIGMGTLCQNKEYVVPWKAEKLQISNLQRSSVSTNCGELSDETEKDTMTEDNDRTVDGDIRPSDEDLLRLIKPNTLIKVDVPVIVKKKTHQTCYAAEVVSIDDGDIRVRYWGDIAGHPDRWKPPPKTGRVYLVDLEQVRKVLEPPTDMTMGGQRILYYTIKDF